MIKSFENFEKKIIATFKLRREITHRRFQDLVHQILQHRSTEFYSTDKSFAKKSKKVSQCRKNLKGGSLVSPGINVTLKKQLLYFIPHAKWANLAP